MLSEGLDIYETVSQGEEGPCVKLHYKKMDSKQLYICGLWGIDEQ